MPVIQLKTSSGNFIAIEVAERSAAQTKAVPKNVLDSFEKIGQSISDVCADVFAKVNLNDLAPDELTLEFSLSIGGELSAPFIAKSSGEGTFTVKAIWKKPQASKKKTK